MGEGALVRDLFFHHFFLGFGTALLYTIGSALFLAHFETKSFAWIFILGGVSLLISGRIYASLEHNFRLSKFLPALLLFLTVSIFLFWIGLNFWMGAIAIFLLMVWHRVVYLLGNLEFWGLSALLFDVRQSKRIFGLISSGDVPAKLLGYALAYYIAKSGGSIEDMLLPAAVSFLIGWLILRGIVSGTKFKSIESGLSHSAHSHAHQGKHENNRDRKAFLSVSPESLLRRLSKNEFINSLAIISFFATTVLSLVDYSFLVEVKARYATDAELAGFLGSFFSIGYGVITLTKFLFSGRLIEKLGIKGTLSFLPATLSFTLLSILILIFFQNTGNSIFILFGITVLGAEIIKYSIQDPAFLALFQPLGREERLHGHGVVKSVSDPIAIIFAGFLLLILSNVFPNQLLLLASVFSLLFLGGWWMYVLRADLLYFNTIRKSLEKRFIGGSAFLMGESIANSFIFEKLKSKQPEEVLFAFEWLKNQNQEVPIEILENILESPNPSIRMAALGRLEFKPNENLLPKIWKLTSSNLKEESILAIIVWAACAKDIDEETANQWLEHKDVSIQIAAIEGMIRHGGLEGIIPAGQKLMQLLRSENAIERREAISLVGKLQQNNFYKPIEVALQDPDFRVREAAVEAAAKIKNPKLFIPLAKCVDQKELRIKSIHALSQFDDSILISLSDLWKDRLSDTHLSEALLRIAGTKNNYSFLLQQYKISPFWKKIALLNHLRKAGYIGKKQDRAFWILEFIECTQHAATLSHYIENREFLDPKGLLKNALLTEFDQAIQRCFIILSFYFDNRAINNAREMWMSAKGKAGDSLGHCLELLEKVLPVNLATPFVILLDSISFTEKAKKLKINPAVKHVHLTAFIFQNELGLTHPWTRAVAINQLSEVNLNLNISNPTTIESLTVSQTLKDMQTFGHHSDTLLSLIEKVMLLKSTSLFSETPEQVLSEVAGIVEEESIEKGKIVFRKGDLGSCMYIISSGRIQIHDESTQLATLAYKDFFGELALLDTEPRSASATAIEDCILLRIDQEPFFDLMTERPEVIRGIMTELCRRIRNQNLRLSESK